MMEGGGMETGHTTRRWVCGALIKFKYLFSDLCVGYVKRQPATTSISKGRGCCQGAQSSLIAV